MSAAAGAARARAARVVSSAIFFISGAHHIPERQNLRHMLSALATALAVAAIPIPSDNGSVPHFSGAPATPHPVRMAPPPRHPFMAPNERSNLHDDAYQTDTYQGLGPLGHDPQVTSTLFTADCASVTFDSQGRI